jgi:hypothetical protein
LPRPSGHDFDEEIREATRTLGAVVYSQARRMASQFGCVESANERAEIRLIERLC